MYILSIILFSGQIINHNYPDVATCNQALYNAMDTIFVKNIDTIECKGAN